MSDFEKTLNVDLMTGELVKNKRNNVLPQECYDIISEWYDSNKSAQNNFPLDRIIKAIKNNPELSARLDQKEEGLADYLFRAVEGYQLSQTLFNLRQI